MEKREVSIKYQNTEIMTTDNFVLLKSISWWKNESNELSLTYGLIYLIENNLMLENYFPKSFCHLQSNFHTIERAM